jgi:5-methylcytosine-specific restriction endonuclease McrA
MKTYQCLNCGTECPVSHQKVNKYCSVTCQQEFQYKVYITEWKQGLKTGISGKDQTSKYVKRYIFEKFDSKCSSCGISEWQEKPISLQLEHIDGNAVNQTEDNLTLLCPNCHSQTESYAGKNRGKGRHSRRIRYAQGKSY